MNPYYQDKFVTIYHGDCREIVPSLPVDDYVVVTDPPYGETNLKWDRWCSEWPSLVAPLTNSMWCFGSLRMFLDNWADFSEWKFSHEVIWEKHNGSGLRRDRFRRIHELALHFFRGPWKEVYAKTPTTPDARKRVVRVKARPPHYWGSLGASTFRSEDGGPKLMSSVIYCRSCHGHAVHPCQKPEGIVLPLLQYAAKPGAVAIDLFAGSFTVARVAKNIGLRSVSIEANEADCEQGAKRMQQEALAL